MKRIITLGFLIILTGISAQNKIYFDEFSKPVSDPQKADFYRIKYPDDSDTNKVLEKSFYTDGRIRSETQYSNYSKKIRNGSYRVWYHSGQIKEKGSYADNKLNDSLVTYWENGQVKRRDLFENGKYISGNVYNSDGTVALHYDYEIIAEFPGGINELMRYLSTNIHYPKKSRKKGISGKVYLQFIIDKEGNLRDITVLKGVNDEINEEAVRVVKNMPKWKPGMIDGNPVNMHFNLPVNFKLTD